MAAITLPDPVLVVLVGAAGVGKSTFATRHFAPSEVLSSDALRAVVAGDESDQRRNGVVFRRLHREVEHRLVRGVTTVVDATNAERGARAALLARARAAGVPAVAIVLDLPAADVLERNVGRATSGGRAVETPVVRRHLERIASIADEQALLAEGFAAAVIIRSAAALDAVEVTRERAVSPPRARRP